MFSEIRPVSFLSTHCRATQTRAHRLPGTSRRRPTAHSRLCASAGKPRRWPPTVWPFVPAQTGSRSTGDLRNPTTGLWLVFAGKETAQPLPAPGKKSIGEAGYGLKGSVLGDFYLPREGDRDWWGSWDLAGSSPGSESGRSLVSFPWSSTLTLGRAPLGRNC